jgi:hypothetical protein
MNYPGKWVIRESVSYKSCLGFLSKKNSLGQTPSELSVGCLEINIASNIIEECIPPIGGYPILHQVVEHVPQSFNHFVLLQYTDCLSKKDVAGRLPLHIALGKHGMGVSVELLLMTQKGALIEKDPTTSNLIRAFVMIPKDNTSQCYNNVYTLFRLNPEACPSH